MVQGQAKVSLSRPRYLCCDFGQQVTRNLLLVKVHAGKCRHRAARAAAVMGRDETDLQRKAILGTSDLYLTVHETTEDYTVEAERWEGQNVTIAMLYRG